MMDCFTFGGECLEAAPEFAYGYVYLIRNIQTGKIYVGKKAFTHSRKTKLSKKARVGTRKRVKVSQVDSKWQSYWGSSKELLADVAALGKENFTREVLAFARNKSELSYLEVYYQITLDVLHVDSYNGWISCKIYKQHLK